MSESIFRANLAELAMMTAAMQGAAASVADFNTATSNFKGNTKIHFHRLSRRSWVCTINEWGDITRAKGTTKLASLVNARIKAKR